MHGAPASPIIGSPIFPGFNPLLDLLNELEGHDSHKQQPSTASASQVETEAYGPMFDLRETEMFYEVHGRLPYRNRDHVQIECTDEHTMVVRVREIEPIFGESSQPESATPTAPTTTTPEAEAEAEAEDKSETSGIKSNKSYQATVEDALEDDEEEDGFSVISSPKATPPESSKSEAAEPNESRWKVVGERNIGESTHTFKFKERVLHHGVVAHMTNGVLKITVPKAKHHPRRIQIN
ncbi:hypothetical protein QBC46DRAFT_255453 [Diplogelasinospora grovesii]|uniref:SHSP domain-containing protein n=1 Tax=Diplogelasinospora grovesii TaxID=303347 RepID=A0AAN6S7D9_9PEZI|nr:hypothetical protein QBC46DRAFT_255453 [Diplogelasinospora grovesii]